MGARYIVLLSVIIAVMANEHPPSNSPYLSEEVKVTAESRILERMEHLLQTFSAKMKILNADLDAVKRDMNNLLLVQNETNASLVQVSNQLQNCSTSATERIIDLERKLEQLPGVIRDTNETTNESLTQRMINLEIKLNRHLGDTGVYLMQPDPSNSVMFEVFRDWTTNQVFGGDWIVFQRRFNGLVAFNRTWKEYKQGFGDLSSEHWLGLDRLHAIVKTRRHELLIVLEDFDGVTKYAHYDDFKIGNERERYVIKSVGNYTGTAGDSFSYHNQGLFSTYDLDNDDSADLNCAENHHGGWWYRNCHNSNLNGEYKNGFINDKIGIVWYQFRGYFYSMKSTKMMIRPFE